MCSEREHCCYLALCDHQQVCYTGWSPPRFPASQHTLSDNIKQALRESSETVHWDEQFSPLSWLVWLAIVIYLGIYTEVELLGQTLLVLLIFTTFYNVHTKLESQNTQLFQLFIPLTKDLYFHIIWLLQLCSEFWNQKEGLQ